MAESNVVSISKILNASANANQLFLKKMLAALAKLWGEFDGWYDDDAVEQAAQQAADVELKVLEQIQRIGIASANQLLRQAGILPETAEAPAVEHPRKVDLVQLWSRPAEQFRYQLSQGKGDAEALSAALTRMSDIAQTDTAMTNRDAKIYQFQRHKVTHYRRMVHPELSRTGVCGLCLVAADRIYGIKDLMPLHGGCNCDVAPIVGDNDPGLKLSQQDLKSIYAGAGDSTAGADLKRVRIQTVQNGELGPVLVQLGGKDYVTSEEARQRRRPRKDKPKKSIDPNSPRALKQKEHRTPEESKRLLALAEDQRSDYDSRIKQMRSEGVPADDPRVLGLTFARRRAEQEIKRWGAELKEAAA